ncbi:MAG: hypothetical protein Q9227_007854 [Pyrenula ochraceoflavens]
MHVLARTTSLVDGRHTVKMTPRLFWRAVAPVGFCFSMSLIFSNQAYLYLSVSFIQMLKAMGPVATYIATCFFGLTNWRLTHLLTICGISFGVMISSMGEIRFSWLGFLVQGGGTVAEALRLALMQYLMSSEDSKMDPLTSLYFFAPVCTVINAIMGIALEYPIFDTSKFFDVGTLAFLGAAIIAFCLNIAQVFVVGRAGSVVLSLCGIPKAVFLVVSSMAFLGELPSLQQFVGFGVSLTGMGIYSKLPSAKRQHNIDGLAREEVKLDNADVQEEGRAMLDAEKDSVHSD